MTSHIQPEVDFFKKINVTWPEEVSLMEDGYKWLGWQVHSDNCPPLKHCRSLEHKTNQVSHSNRGSDHTYWCDDCMIWWKIDSSD